MFGMRRRTLEALASSHPIASRCGAACPDAHTTSPMGVCGTPQLSPKEFTHLPASPTHTRAHLRVEARRPFLTSCSCCGLSVPHKPTTAGLISHGGSNLGGKCGIRGCQNTGGHGDCCPYSLLHCLHHHAMVRLGNGAHREGWGYEGGQNWLSWGAPSPARCPQMCPAAPVSVPAPKGAPSHQGWVTQQPPPWHKGVKREGNEEPEAQKVIRNVYFFFPF